MGTTRRRFNFSVGAALVAAACSGDDDEGASSGGGGAGGGAGEGGSGAGELEPVLPSGEPPESWVPDGDEDGDAFPTGVQVGDVTESGAIVSVHTSEQVVALQVAVGDDDGWEQLAPLSDLNADDGVVQVELTDLQADRTHAVAFFAADGTRRSAVSRFRSAVAPGNTRVVRFGATSCLGGNEPWATLSFAAQQRYDFFCLLGDTVYADWAPSSYEYDLKWADALAVPGMRDLAATTSFIATWDDHEVDNNWNWDTPGIEEQVAVAQSAYRRGIPQREGSGTVGIWRKLSWGDVLDVFVLECRGERVAGNYISAEQMTWLKDGLSNSTAQFKIIMNSVPIIDFTGTLVGAIKADDRWQGYPEQRGEIISHIDDNRISGVLWIAGDFHIGGVAKVSPAGEPGENSWEVLCGPGGSPLNPATNLIEPDDRIPVIVGTWNYTHFEVDPDAGTVRVAHVDDAGAVVGERTLSNL